MENLWKFHRLFWRKLEKAQKRQKFQRDEDLLSLNSEEANVDNESEYPKAVPVFI